jgi:6-pyruvoyltetrahydropterin/6-carboxytetrahydropterin synthase
MFEIKVVSFFSSAHFLREYKGKCENLHGHNWKVEAVIGRRELTSQGLVMDFGDLKKILKGILDGLDHTLINELEYFKTNNPTSENLAKYVYGELKKAVAPGGCAMVRVNVWEQRDSCASYYEM